MANTYSQVYLHLVFSTKNRTDLIHREIEERVWAYIAGVARHHGITPIQIGGIENHIHALLSVPTTLSPSQVAKHVKGDSSYGIRREFEGMSDFGWQDGYGVFSVSRSAVPDVVDYIVRQRDHHSTRSFEEEYVRLLENHGIDYDDKYLFD
ncbi:MAG TPA: IS200/IS605 family transposase [Pyrinomonadaceae bacterium]|nr:IS200/IS605 family transposase [Chloracidobacterium sp.]MBK9436573.1 IS200/IS605 family transposase [Chloracidobacterium sp.]MBP9935799.1 IS200/IS605 family transposase [Pyrinomonadaceae bacterium]HQX55733.1 IS200/IS605 family transposase [Pyrinomonadaceae bacterium]HRA40718.1 IS200/IS605 family transposase [Pyrinomonadaceae bacterium]